MGHAESLPGQGQVTTWRRLFSLPRPDSSGRAKASGIAKAALAQKLGIPTANVDRLFDFKNHTRLEQIEAAFHALGKRLTIDVRDAG